MTSDVFGSFLTYLPTLIRYRQMWLDLPTYLPTPRSDVRFLKFTGVYNMGLIFLLRAHPTTMSPHFSNFMSGPENGNLSKRDRK